MKSTRITGDRRFKLVCLCTLLLGLGFYRVAVCIPPAEIETEQTVSKAKKARRQHSNKTSASRAARAARAAQRAEAERKASEAKRRQLEESIAKMKVAQADKTRKKAIKDEEMRLASVGDIILQCSDEKGNPIPNLDLVMTRSFLDPGSSGRMAGVKTYPDEGYQTASVEIKTDENGAAIIPKQKCYLYSYSPSLTADENQNSAAENNLENILDIPEWELVDDDSASFSFPGFHKPITVNLKLRRQKGDVEISGPKGGKIKLGSQQIAEIVENEPCRFSLPLELGGRGLKLAVVKETEVGIMAGTASIPTLAPYDTTHINDIPLTLQAIKNVEIAGNIDVGMSASDVESALGKPTKIFDTLVPNTNQPGKMARSGSKTWEYPDKGISIQMRDITFMDGTRTATVESIKLSSAKSGSIAGISIGDPSEKLRDTIGEGIQLEESRQLSYLDNGIKFEKARLQVASIEVTREKRLLMEGTPAFVHPRRPRFHISNVESNDVTMRSQIISSIRGMFDAIGPYIIVESEDEADYRVSTKLISCTSEHSNYNEERKDNNGNKRFVPMVEITARASISIEVMDVDTGSSLLSSAYDGKGSEHVEAISYSESDDSSCRSKAVQSTTYKLLDDLYNVKPIVARVIAVDYTANKVRINLGKLDGIQPRSSYQRPTEFCIMVDGNRLLNNDQHYVEATEDVGDDYAVLECCSKNSLGKTKIDWTVLLQIPDPASARVVAVMKPRHGDADKEEATGSKSGGGLFD